MRRRQQSKHRSRALHSVLRFQSQEQLTNTKMSIDRGISGGTGKVLVLTVGNVEVSLGVTVLLGKTEIDDVDLVASLADTHEEVVGLDIAVDERLGMDVFDSRDELVGEEKDRLQSKLAVAEVEEILQARAQEVQDHGIVVTLGTEPADKGDTDTASQRLVDAGLIFELGVLGLHALQLDGNLLSRYDVGAQVDVAERSRSNLSTNTVLVTDA